MKDYTDKLGMRKLVILTTMFLIGIAGASAQTATITDADSNLTDTQITAEFTGLPTDTQLEIQSLGDDTTTVKTFTTTSAGTATVTWRHNPFEDGTALISDGWTYAVRSSDGSTNFEFEVAHGNMLLGLDMFNDNSLNTDLWSSSTSMSESSCIESYARESSQNIELSTLSTDYTAPDGCFAEIDYEDSVSSKGTAIFNINSISTGGDDSFTNVYVSDGSGSQIASFEPSTGLHRIYLSDEGVRVTNNGQEVLTSSTTSDEFSLRFRTALEDFDGGSTEIIIDSFSVIPSVSRSAWSAPNQFNPQTQSLLFGDFLVNQPKNVGLEFSSDGSSWSVTPPSSGEQLYYRNTGSGTLGAVAVDTSELLGGLTFNPLQPNNNTAFVVEENASLSQEFIYEFLYERSDCSEFAGITVGWTLYNETSGNELSQSVYPSGEMTEGQCTYYREFTEEETLPAGDYRWTAQFTEGNIGVTRFYDMYFSIEEADQVPVSFELRDPQDGADVELSNSTYQFEYSVDAQEPGTLEFVIPQYEDSVRYSTSIPAGNTTQSVELDLNDDQTYDWYLTYSNETTYQSSTNTFTALAETTDGDNGDGDNGDGEEPEYDLEQIYYNVMQDFFGVDEQGANTIAMSIIVIAVAAFGGYIAGGLGFITGGILGMLISFLIGVAPDWIAAVFIISTALLTTLKLGDSIT